MKHNERARVAPLYLTFTHPFRTQKIHERPPAAAAAAAVRHAAARHAAVRHAACLRRREESNGRCYVSSLALLMATASGRVATPISSAPVRRTLQTTEVPCVEASTSTTMSRARRRPAAAAAAFEVRLGHDHLTIVETFRRSRFSPAARSAVFKGLTV